MAPGPHHAARRRRTPPPRSPARRHRRCRLHAGDCWGTRKRCVPAGAEQVRRLLAEGVPACIHSRPDSALGMLE
ncbi:DUF6233 domain-containing protein [Streptomyces goshikiensis]|uniref:DUF6233 domain-containing protein n=1 Tax=Streptomyces goshikiensis TaxID=1942 RepID=UPI00365072D4